MEQAGILEYGNTGMLGILLKLHYSIVPLFHHSGVASTTGCRFLYKYGVMNLLLSDQDSYSDF
jgi:hypothetical protein